MPFNKSPNSTAASPPEAFDSSLLKASIESLPAEIKSNPDLLAKFIQTMIAGLSQSAAADAAPIKKKEDLFQNEKDSVVMIKNLSEIMNLTKPGLEGRIQHSHGTGVVIDAEQKWILTNEHVTSNAKELKVGFGDDGIFYKAKNVYESSECDLSLISLDSEQFWARAKPISISAKEATRGDDVLAMGFPKGGSTLSFTNGSFSREDSGHYANSGAKLPIAQISTPINNGNSGGPAFNGEHQLVGITHQGMNDAQNISYMIPLSVINKFLTAARANAPTIFPSLHIRMKPLKNKAARAHFGIDKEEYANLGLEVNLISQFSPASGILNKRDILIGIDDYNINHSGSLVKQVGGPEINQYISTLQTYMYMKNIGDDVNFRLVRDGKEIKVTFPLTKSIEELDLVRSTSKTPKFYVNNGVVCYELTAECIPALGQLVMVPEIFKKINGYKTLSLDEVPVLLLTYFDNTSEEGATHGYSQQPLIINSVNDIPIVNLEHLKEVMESSTETHHIIASAGDEPNIVIIPNLPKAELREKLAKAGYSIQYTPGMVPDSPDMEESREGGASARPEVQTLVAASIGLNLPQLNLHAQGAANQVDEPQRPHKRLKLLMQGN